MEDIELLASFDPPQDSRFKFWAYGKCEHLTGTRGGSEIGASYRVTVSKKQNLQGDTPVRLNLDYTMIMALASGEKLKTSLVFVEEDEHEIRGYAKVLEVEPEAVLLL